MIYIWSTTAVFVSTLTGQCLIVENHTSILSIQTIGGMVLNIVLNAVLIPRLGMNGAAFATLVSYSFVTISIVFFKQTRKLATLIANAFVFKV
jgi:O-antigen/teichoic acid export membrane protein